MPNADEKTVRDFGREWTTFDQSRLPERELDDIFNRYFRIFRWHELPARPVGMDVGCGSGRWAKRVAPRVHLLHCIDASAEALEVAQRNLETAPNCRFHHASIENIPLEDGSLDFGYSLGVLHHLPDTEAGLSACVRKLRPGAPFLLYVYYALDNKPKWFRLLWRLSDLIRTLTSRLPHGVKVALSTFIAGAIYLPLARFARLSERWGRDPAALPLSFYRRLSFYTMRTDALDRFGTRVERRFRKDQVIHLMEAAGMTEIEVSPDPPYWCAVGYRVN